MADSSDGKGEKPPDNNENNGQDKTDNKSDGEIFDNVYNTQCANGTSFRVIVDKIEKDSTISNLKIGELMNKITSSANINEIKRVSRNRVVVNLRTPQAANFTVNHDQMRNNGLKAYIPLYYTSRAAVIRDVDIEYDDNKLKENIDARQFCVRKVERLNRRVIDDNKITYKPSRSVKIFFDGQDIPQHIYIFNVRFECEPFIRKLRQCLKCLRFGHGSNGCSGTERCTKCAGDSHKAKGCEVKEIKCANCLGRHSAFDRQCPEKIRQQNINMAMGLYNLSYQEANMDHPKTYMNTRSYSFMSQNRFQILANDDENFPELNPSQQIQAIPLYNPPPKHTVPRKRFQKIKFKSKSQYYEDPISQHDTTFRQAEPIQYPNKRRPRTSDSEDQGDKTDENKTAEIKKPENKKVRNNKANDNTDDSEKKTYSQTENIDEQNDVEIREIDSEISDVTKSKPRSNLGIELETDTNFEMS